MRQSLLALTLLLCAAGAHAQTPYTLVLGVGNAGKGRGYQDYAAENCPTAERCLTYCDLYDRYKCESCRDHPTRFYECVVSMMASATTIVFVVDKPGSPFVAADECGPEQPCPQEGSHFTRLELWALRHCDRLYARTLWRNLENAPVTMTFSGDCSACPQ